MVCLASIALPAEAAGLGDLSVRSALGEPFRAEISLMATAQEMESMSARVAPKSVYADLGIERPTVLDAVQIDLHKQPGGGAVLRLNSPQPIEDPFMQVLVQLDWANGQLLREYNALLDPPGFGDQVAQISLPSARRQAPMQAAVKAAPTDVPAAAPVELATAMPPGSALAPAPADPQDTIATEAIADEERGEGYTVRRGDTLRSIARRLKPDGVSVERMLVGLFRGNPDAFVGDNMNRLKVGEVLFAPLLDELQAISQKEALREIRLHGLEWRALRGRPAMARSGTPGARNPKSGATASLQAPVAAPKPPAKFVLKVSPGDATWSATPRSAPASGAK